MRRILVDSNVVLSFLTDRDPQQQASGAKLFESAGARSIELVLHQQTLAECVDVLENLYLRPAVEVSDALRQLLALPGVATMDEVPWSTVLEEWPTAVPDFGDAVLAAAARHARLDAVATFDQPFRRRLRRLGIVAESL